MYDKSAPNTEANHFDRRDVALALLGALGSSTLLQACMEQGAPSPQEGQATAALSGSNFAWLDNITTDLMAIKGGTTAANTNVVIVRGFATPAAGLGQPDGGGGIFVWDPSSNTGHNGGTIIVPTAPTSGRWMRVYSGSIDIRWFGAVPNSTAAAATNLAAFNAAIAAASAVGGGTVYVPAGTWYVNGTISLVALTNILLEGEPCFYSPIAGVTQAGTGSTIKPSATFSSSVPGSPIINFDHSPRCGIHQLGIDGVDNTLVPRAGIGLRVYAISGAACHFCFFERVNVINFGGGVAPGRGIYVGGGGDVSNNIFSHFTITSASYGIYQDGSQSVLNTFTHGVVNVLASGYGMYFAEGDITVENVQFQGSNTSGADVYVAGSAVWARFINNYHETYATAYKFAASLGRSEFTLFSGVRVLVKSATGLAVQYEQIGPVVTQGCKWEFATVPPSDVVVAIWSTPTPSNGNASVITEVGSRYGNKAIAQVSGNATYWNALSSTSGSQNPVGITQETRLVNGAITLQSSPGALASANPPGGWRLYIDGSGNLMARNSAGTVKQLAP